MASRQRIRRASHVKSTLQKSASARSLRGKKSKKRAKRTPLNEHHEIAECMDCLDEAICIVTAADDAFMRRQDSGYHTLDQAALRTLHVGASRLRTAQRNLDEALAEVLV
jgi:hypothetical protein